MEHPSTFEPSLGERCPYPNHEDTNARNARKNVTKLTKKTEDPRAQDFTARCRRCRTADVTTTIGCCIDVHRDLGPGLFERIYARALCIELKAAGIPFEREKRYRGEVSRRSCGAQCLDFVVAEQIVLEVKSVEQLASIHHKQILNYMRVAACALGCWSTSTCRFCRWPESKGPVISLVVVLSCQFRVVRFVPSWLGRVFRG